MSRYKDNNLDSTDFEEYIDTWGLIVTGEGDGGDTCANQFTYYYCIMHNSAPIEPRLASLPRSFQLLTGPSGIPIRHPANRYGDWAASTQATSRDQFTCYLLALMVCQDKPRIAALWTAHLKRGLLTAWNIVRNGQANKSGPYKKPDITGPDIWSLWIRTYRAYWAYPLLMVLDIQNLIAVLIDVLWYESYNRGLFGIKTLPDKDQRNLALKTHACATYMPTPLSLLGFWIYKSSGLAQYGFKAFWQRDSNEPPIHALMLRLIYGK